MVRFLKKLLGMNTVFSEGIRPLDKTGVATYYLPKWYVLLRPNLWYICDITGHTFVGPFRSKAGAENYAKENSLVGKIMQGSAVLKAMEK